MKISRSVWIWVVIAIGVIALFLMLGYGNLKGKQLDYKKQLAKIASTQERNANVITNEVANVKGFYKYNKDLVDSATKAIAALSGAQTPQEAESAKKALGDVNTSRNADGSYAGTGIIGRLLAVSLAYPDPKGIELNKQLGVQLEGSANRLKFERDLLAERATDYNRAVEIPPSSLVAWLFHFESITYFEASSTQQQFPTVNLEQ